MGVRSGLKRLCAPNQELHPAAISDYVSPVEYDQEFLPVGGRQNRVVLLLIVENQCTFN